MKKKQSYPKKEFKEPNIKRLSSSAHSSITINTDADDTRQKREISNSKRVGSNISDDRKEKRMSGLVNNGITFTGDLEDKKKDSKEKRLSGINQISIKKRLKILKLKKRMMN